MALVLAGTLGQAHLSNDEAQARFFRSVVVWLDVWGMRIPVLPGGHLLGGIVMAPLLAVLVVRFRRTFRNGGLYLVHGGLVILLAGGLLANRLSVESRMVLREGETANYSEDLRLREVVFWDGTREMVVPEDRLKRAGVSVPDGLYGGRWMESEGVWWKVDVRPLRHEKAYSLTLKSFSRECYAGTEIPRRFTSCVALNTRDQTAPREAVISMNHPLRFEGETFYQAGVGPDGKTTVLQVVRNPAAAAPYVACLLIFTGLGVHFILTKRPNLIPK